MKRRAFHPVNPSEGLQELMRVMGQGASLAMLRDLIESAAVRAALEDCRGNQCEAARRLGVHRNTLGRLLEKYDIVSRDYRRRPVVGLRQLARERVWGAA